MGNYVSNAEVAAYLGLDTSIAAVSAQLTAVVPVAEDMVESYCRTIFVDTGSDVSKTVDGNGLGYIPLHTYISAITSVYLVDKDGTNLSLISDCAIGPYAVYDRKGAGTMLESKTGFLFPKGVRNIKITGRFGFTTIPSEIKLACYVIIKHLFDVSEHNFLHKEEEFFGKNTVNVPYQDIHAVPKLAAQLLDKYRMNTNFDNLTF